MVISSVFFPLVSFPSCLSYLLGIIFTRLPILSVPIDVIILISEGMVKLMEAKTLFLFMTTVNFNSEFTGAVHNVTADGFPTIRSRCKPQGINSSGPLSPPVILTVP